MRIPVSIILLTFHVAYSTQDDDVREFYSSVSSMTKLVARETILLGVLQEVIRRKYVLKTFIEDYINQVAKVTPKTEENPVDAFKLVYRCYHDLAELEQQMLRTDHSEAYEKETTELDIYVEGRELKGATMALDRLQHIYELPTDDLARGILLGHIGPQMTGADCFEMGRFLYSAGYVTRALQWLTHARLRQNTDPENLNELSLVSYLASSYFYLGNYKMALKLCREMLEIDPTNTFALKMIEDAKKESVTFRRLSMAKQSTPSVQIQQPRLSMNDGMLDMYERTCRGELTQTPREKRDLRCRYTSNNVPFCILAPFKMEEMSLDPYIRVFYDVLYDGEISFLKNETEELMTRSQVVSEGADEVSEVRTSQNAWLKLEELKPLANLAVRLDDITGLSLDGAEDLQVLNYGIGGHYEAHYDFLDGEQANFKGYLGNRILTALFYMSDVELGGGTGFPFLRALVPPIKGSLVVWYNEYESLEADYRTLHGGCPVLRGNKYIATVWYHSTYQEFRRPCLLYENPIHQQNYY